MPGKRDRRHFSQLSEFERGLIIGMKTAGWLTRRVVARCIVWRVPLEIVGSSGHEKVPRHEKSGLERPRRPRGERDRSDRAASTYGLTVLAQRYELDVDVAIVPQTFSETPCRSKSSIQNALSVHPS
ncbi:hypothetical protein TNCV_2172221 [Trichonephila clavipes]|nr:hypothetical protein TNCV_2172221 [Trichonephila clavipes]